MLLIIFFWMKKTIFMFVAMIAMTFAACGNKTAKSASTSDSDTTVVDSVDSATADSVSAISVGK